MKANGKEGEKWRRIRELLTKLYEILYYIKTEFQIEVREIFNDSSLYYFRKSMIFSKGVAMSVYLWNERKRRGVISEYYNISSQFLSCVKGVAKRFCAVSRACCYLSANRRFVVTWWNDCVAFDNFSRTYQMSKYIYFERGLYVQRRPQTWSLNETTEVYRVYPIQKRIIYR